MMFRFVVSSIPLIAALAVTPALLKARRRDAARSSHFFPAWPASPMRMAWRLHRQKRTPLPYSLRQPARLEFEKAFAVPAAHYAIILAGKDGIAATTEAAV